MSVIWDLDQEEVKKSLDGEFGQAGDLHPSQEIDADELPPIFEDFEGWKVSVFCLKSWVPSTFCQWWKCFRKDENGQAWSSADLLSSSYLRGLRGFAVQGWWQRGGGGLLGHKVLGNLCGLLQGHRSSPRQESGPWSPWWDWEGPSLCLNLVRSCLLGLVLPGMPYTWIKMFKHGDNAATQPGLGLCTSLLLHVFVGGARLTNIDQVAWVKKNSCWANLPTSHHLVRPCPNGRKLIEHL